MKNWQKPEMNLVELKKTNGGIDLSANEKSGDSTKYATAITSLTK